MIKCEFQVLMRLFIKKKSLKTMINDKCEFQVLILYANNGNK